MRETQGKVNISKIIFVNNLFLNQQNAEIKSKILFYEEKYLSVLRDIPKSLGLIKRLHDDYLQYFIKCQCNTQVFSILN